jgi:hypothetical protein
LATVKNPAGGHPGSGDIPQQKNEGGKKSERNKMAALLFKKPTE